MQALFLCIMGLGQHDIGEKMDVAISFIHISDVQFCAASLFVLFFVVVGNPVL